MNSTIGVAWTREERPGRAQYWFLRAPSARGALTRITQPIWECLPALVALADLEPKTSHVVARLWHLRMWLQWTLRVELDAIDWMVRKALSEDTHDVVLGHKLIKIVLTIRPSRFSWRRRSGGRSSSKLGSAIGLF